MKNTPEILFYGTSQQCLLKKNVIFLQIIKLIIHLQL